MKVDLGQVEDAARELYVRALKILPPDIKEGFRRIGASETDATAIAVLESAGSPEHFLEQYRHADRVLVRLGELLVREGRTAEARALLRRAMNSPRSVVAAFSWWMLSFPVAMTPRGRGARR